MGETYTIGTLNINCIESENKIQMLEHFLHRNDIDILLVQEVTTDILHQMRGYTSYLNVGTSKRGTALIAKEPLNMTEIATIPSGRGIAATCTGLRIVNIYAPSGAERRHEREHFFNVEMSYLLGGLHTPLVLGGDFNSVVAPTDCTGGYNYSRTLDRLIKGLGLHDTWQGQVQGRGYTHYTYQGAARLDRIYVTEDLLGGKTGAAILFAPFTDHMAATVRITLRTPMIRRGKGYWKMNNSLLKDQEIKGELMTNLKAWSARQRKGVDINVWWDSYVKKQIQYYLKRKGTERKKEEEAYENFLHTCIHDAIMQIPDLRRKKTILNRCKAEMTLIHKRRMEKVNLNTHQHTPYPSENTSLYQILKAKRRRASTMIGSIKTDEGTTENTMNAIMRVFKSHMQGRFAATTTDVGCIQDMINVDGHTLTAEQQQRLEIQVTREEVRRAIHGGQKNKAPGSDGTSLEFFQETWDEMADLWVQIFRKMFDDGTLTPRQKHGLIVCVPKILTPRRPPDYRPITLLNADYKILARIIVERMKPLMNDLLHQSQYCGRQEVTIHDALDSIRDIIAYTEHRHQALCILALDFAEAFDRIDHTYLDRILERYGFGDHIRQLIKNMYTDATSSIQINGHISSPIPIKKSIRQGCPLSMALYALCVNPLLQQLSKQLRGVRIGSRGTNTTAIAYADDVSIIISDKEDIRKLQATLDTYSRASGAKINITKSRILPLGGWDERINILDIQYTHQLKILGITFARTTEHSCRHTWTGVVGKVRGMASQAYSRDLCLTQRIWYAHTYLLSVLWYTAQVLPPTQEATRQITAVVTRYLWKGNIFRVPVSILYNEPQAGGLGLVDLQAKCLTLLITRLWKQCNRTHGVSSDWMQLWNIAKKKANPPNLSGIPMKYEYLRCYVRESAYLPVATWEQSTRCIKKHLYNNIRTFGNRTRSIPVSRIQRTYPNVQWAVVWRNISQAWVDEDVRSTWYEVVNDLIATNVRLHKIRIAATEQCQHCGEKDTLQHRLTECGDTKQIWTWTRARMSWFLRTDQRWIPEDWIWAPSYQVWPPQRHNAISWILGNMTYYVIKNRKTISMVDYLDYMQRSRWKTYQRKKRATKLGNYLEVLG